MSKIVRALLSVSDKTGIVEFAKSLAAAGIEILSTGGTARTLRDAGVPVKDVSDFTGFPEMMDGRVKTLHPKVHGAILRRRDNEQDSKECAANGVEAIDLVVVNLYPFEETVAKRDCTFEKAIENIDIGGPTMLRSAAKNHKDVVVVVDPADYDRILEKIGYSGEVPADMRFELCRKVFAHTAKYDAAISAWLNKQDANAVLGGAHA